MQRYFIADLHLSEDEPAITAGFFDFIDELPNSCELYILGDLFDYWIGDDALTQLHQQVATRLKQLSVRGIKKYFVCGNRDFLVGKRYATACDMLMLSDINCLPLSNKSDRGNVLILHGDLLCTDDKGYQKFRKIMHNKPLQLLYSWLPLYLRRRIADALRKKSKGHNREKAEYIMDVNQNAVVELMTKHAATTMVHGHTHKPATHTFLSEGTLHTRIVLAAWHDGISYLKQDDDDSRILFYSQPFK